MSAPSDQVTAFRAMLSQRAGHAKGVLELGPEVMHPLSEVVRRANGWLDVPTSVVNLFKRAEAREAWRKAGDWPLP